MARRDTSESAATTATRTPSGQDASPTPASRSQKLIMWGVPIASVVVVALALVAVVVGARVRATPGWWSTIDPASERVMQTGRDIEHALSGQATLQREMLPDPDVEWDPSSDEPERLLSEEWSFSLTTDQANAWLATRLRPWVESQGHTWPAELGAIRVHFEDDRFIAGAAVEREGESRYLTASLKPELRDDGSLWLRAEHVSIGTLALPASWVLDRAEERKDEIVPEPFRGLPEAGAFFRVFAGEVPLSEQPEFRLPGDQRRVRLVKLRMIDDADNPRGPQRMAVTCRTEWTPRSSDRNRGE